MNDEKCPCCPNHCEKDNLGCGRGREYYSKSNDSKPLTINEEIISNLRKCGHLLHHNKEIENSNFLSVLSDNELNELHKILSKICSNIER